jgi:hypothetical protein
LHAIERPPSTTPTRSRASQGCVRGRRRALRFGQAGGRRGRGGLGGRWLRSSVLAGLDRARHRRRRRMTGIDPRSSQQSCPRAWRSRGSRSLKVSSQVPSTAVPALPASVRAPTSGLGHRRLGRRWRTRSRRRLPEPGGDGLADARTPQVRSPTGWVVIAASRSASTRMTASAMSGRS